MSLSACNPAGVELLADRSTSVSGIRRYHAHTVVAHAAPRRFVAPGSRGYTAGAACMVGRAEQLMIGPPEVVLANSDHLVDTHLAAFVALMREQGADAGILTLRASEPKWSFAKVG
jgi:hypothetical protein